LAQDAYVVGITAALTGPPASTYAPAMEALRIYIDRVNAAGGANGKPIKLVFLDDSAEPSKAAANMKRLTTQDNAVLLVNASLSSTYAPVVGESKRANNPLLFASGVCPKDVYPPADPLQFCTTAYASTFDSRAALTYIKDNAKGQVQLGLAAMAIPLSRGEMEFAQKLAPDFGFKVVGLEVIPPPTPDYTPFATKIKEAGANWVFSWAPWVTQVRTLEALRRLGWADDYITWSHLEAEGELVRLKDPKLNVIGANSLYQDNLPIHQEIRAAVKKADIKYPWEAASISTTSTCRLSTIAWQCSPKSGISIVGPRSSPGLE
jgi:ABC-type branched-subunit amino acid transport system substrate-binding protein